MGSSLCVDAIMELSGKGYSLYVLSNMHKHSFEYLSKTYDIWRYFSGIVISSHIKSIKPEPEYLSISLALIILYREIQCF